MTTLKTIPKISKQKEILFNENNVCLSPLCLFSIKENLNGLTVIIRGGYYNKNDGTSILINDKMINLSINNTHYIYFNTTTNLIENNIIGFSNGNIALYTVTTNATKITNISDKRKVGLYSYLEPSIFYNNYTLPIATTTTIGGVKPDNETIIIDGFGEIKDTTNTTNTSTVLTYKRDLLNNLVLTGGNIDNEILTITLSPGTYYITYYVDVSYSATINAHNMILEFKDNTNIYSHNFNSTSVGTGKRQLFHNLIITLTENKILYLNLKFAATSSQTATALSTTNNLIANVGATRLIAIKL